MKNIYSLLAACLLATISLTGCSDEDPFATATEDDYPQILLPWFGEWQNGEPVEYKSITRDMVFEDSCVVTPSQYTTVAWYIDGEKIAEGTHIKEQFLAGTYTLKIVATTTKGASTSRTGLLVVRPLAGDPSVSNSMKYRQMVANTHVAVEGNDLDDIVKVIIGGMEADAKFVNDKLEFDVPDLALGEYRLVLVAADGQQYGSDKVIIAEEPYSNPAAEPQEITLWEGDFAVTWGTPFNVLAGKFKSLIAEGTVYPGTIVRAYVEGGAGAKAALTSAWWRNILTGAEGEGEVRGDIEFTGEKMLEWELNETSIDLINNQDGLFLVGDGYNVKKVDIFTIPAEAQGGDDGSTIFEGTIEAPEWGPLYEDLNGKVTDLINKGTIKVGTKITFQGSRTAADYCSIALIDQSWTSVIDGSTGDDRTVLHFASVGDGQSDSFVVSQKTIDIVKAGGFYINGHGFVINKITFE